MPDPVICFGQQPCGIFPKRFLVAKIITARRLQKEIGGRVVFFYHDSDHDYRETATLMKNRRTGEMQTLNFVFPNKIHKKFTPLFKKHYSPDWKEKTLRQLPNFVDKEVVDIFKSVETTNVADFCREVYNKMGWLEGIDVVCSSDPELRKQAIDIDDYFLDAPFKGELVRTRYRDGQYCLHHGGSKFEDVQIETINKCNISPTRDSRLLWMQSVLHCTHYIAGAGEINYLNTDEAPEINFLKRDPIERSSEAYINCCHD